jgi:D-3-phosphoglycerate dehydrogenase
MEKKKVIVVEHIDESGIKILEESNLAEVIYYDGLKSQETYLKDLKSAHALLMRITELNGEMIRSAEHLKIISKHGVGFDNIDVPAATERKMPVTITPGANSDAVAEHALAMMFSLARNIRPADTDLKEQRFKKKQDYIGIELRGKTVGIIGLGRIGSRVALKCSQAFTMRVLTYDPFISPEYASRFGAEWIDNLETILTTADFVTFHCPLSHLTEYMIDAAQLKMMKKTAFIINTARGGIINESTLFEALKENWIGGAALDVFVKEPARPHENPLLSLDNVLVTPHLAGSTKESGIKMATMAAEEIVRVLRGEKPKNPINPEIYG